MYAERLMPQNVEAEEAVLGSVLIDPECLDQLVTLLRPGDFVREKHSLIWEALQALYKQRVNPDQITVAQKLQMMGMLEVTGGMAFLSHLVAITPTSAHAGYYASIVNEMSKLRQIVGVASQVAAQAYDLAPSATIAEGAVQQLLSLRTGEQDRQPKSLAEMYDEYQAEIVAEIEGLTGTTRGVPTGLGALDRMLNGWQRGLFYVLGARTSVGKTMLSNCFAMNVARRQRPVFIFSLESPRKALLHRMINANARVDYFRYRLLTGDSPDRERLKDTLIDALNEVQALPIWIDDRRGLKPVDIRATLTAHSKVHDTPALVIVDYLNLVKPGRDRGKAYDNVSDAVRDLKDIGGELDVPMLVMAQLSRAPEARTEAARRPTLQDFRDSGVIEEVASCMMGLYRASYYYKPEEWSKTYPNKPYPEHDMELLVLKQQEGPVGTVPLFVDLPSGFVGEMASWSS